MHPPATPLTRRHPQPSKRQRVRLYYGGDTEATIAYKDSFNNWAGRGVEVIPVYADQGFVQDVFNADPDLADPAQTAALLCGGSALMDGCTAVLQELGVTVILKNY